MKMRRSIALVACALLLQSNTAVGLDADTKMGEIAERPLSAANVKFIAHDYMKALDGDYGKFSTEEAKKRSLDRVLDFIRRVKNGQVPGTQIPAQRKSVMKSIQVYLDNLSDSEVKEEISKLVLSEKEQHEELVSPALVVMASKEKQPVKKEVKAEDAFRLPLAFQEIRATKVTFDNAVEIAVEYGKVLRAFSKQASRDEQIAMLDQVQEFVVNVIENFPAQWERVRDTLRLDILESKEVPFFIKSRLSDFMQAQDQERGISSTVYTATRVEPVNKEIMSASAQSKLQDDDDWFKSKFRDDLERCKSYFSRRSEERYNQLVKKVMIKRLENLIERGAVVYQKLVNDGTVSENDFFDDFYEPVIFILGKIEMDQEGYPEGLSDTLQKKFEDSVAWYEKKQLEDDKDTSSSWKRALLYGLMASGAAHGIASQFNAPRPGINVAASGQDVVELSSNATASQAQVFEASDVQLPPAPAPQVIVAAPDAIDLMRAGTTTQTKTELPVHQSYAPRPGFGESVRGMVTGNTADFYDPVARSGFDINKVRETQAAESEIARLERSKALESAKDEVQQQQHEARIKEQKAKAKAAKQAEAAAKRIKNQMKKQKRQAREEAERKERENKQRLEEQRLEEQREAARRRLQESEAEDSGMSWYMNRIGKGIGKFMDQAAGPSYSTVPGAHSPSKVFEGAVEMNKQRAFDNN